MRKKIVGLLWHLHKFYALQQLWIQRIILLSEYHMYGFLRRHHAHFRKPVQCQNVCSRDWQQL